LLSTAGNATCPASDSNPDPTLLVLASPHCRSWLPLRWGRWPEASWLRVLGRLRLHAALPSFADVHVTHAIVCERSLRVRVQRAHPSVMLLALAVAELARIAKILDMTHAMHCACVWLWQC